ncbi:MAG: hypothetical protein KYQ20_00380 [Candidatus Nealsonbacteria bacterium]|nr:hypothetical protein [Candidatus Nealsonbacteria bacterium]
MLNNKFRVFLANGRSRLNSLPRNQKIGAIVILVFVIVVLYLWLASLIVPLQQDEAVIKQEEIPVLKTEQDAMIQKQLEELDKLRGEIQPLKEKEIQAQIRELEKLRQRTKPLSPEEIQRQLEELEKLR